MANYAESSMEQCFFDQFFRSAPVEVDVEAIRREWLALKPPYCVEERRLPLPVWARRGLAETGQQAWAILSREVGRNHPTRPFCIYVHIPFCASRCSFCDCYSFRLKQHRDEHLDRYGDLLRQEMGAWSQLGTLAQRPVSTVHFGGGTPTLLGEERFSRLVYDLRERFHMGPSTEWALESTTSELTPEMCSRLDALGFTRLHIGVQSLEDPVRRLANRREPAAVVREKIAQALRMGWVVSVDLILGLPGQCLEGLLEDIKFLAAVGVDGFSLYELQLSSRNRKFAEEHGLVGRSHLGNYFLMQAASRLLAALGYRKTLFNHFARERDTDLYFTFPERGEDCLALGTIADGVFDDYHYRHPEYAAYCRDIGEGFPALQGGLRRNDLEKQLRPLEIALLSGTISPGPFFDWLGEDLSEKLFSYWRELALVEDDTTLEYPPAIPKLRLTANGSWLVATMMAQLSDRRFDFLL